MNKLFIILLSGILLNACQANDEVVNEEIIILIDSLQHQFVPDRRVNRLDVQAVQTSSVVILKGETTLPVVKQALLDKLNEKTIAYVDSINVLPAPSLGDSYYALAHHAVVNLRSERGHSQELATQVLLGTPLKVLKQEKEWYWVQCPDGYLAWVNAGEITRKTAAELKHWQQSRRAVFTKEYGASYVSPDEKGERVGDLVEGAILQVEQEDEKWTKIVYPDDRKAFVKTEALVDWGNQPRWSIEQTMRLAKLHLGKPYFWGGTSSKAMDCSGFTKTVYQQQGYIIPRDASQQVMMGVPVEYDEDLDGLEKGDFLFFGRYKEDGSEKITHVGLYVGDGAFIHSGADVGANIVQNLLPEHPRYAEHRRQSLLLVKRISPEAAGVVAMRSHPWYQIIED